MASILHTRSGPAIPTRRSSDLSPTTNLITNGGFELGGAAWSLAAQATIDPNPAEAHSGSNSLQLVATAPWQVARQTDRKSTRLNSSHVSSSYAGSRVEKNVLHG